MFEFFVFLVAASLAFFIPGSLALYPLRRSFAENLVLGTIIGIVLWSIQGYVFGSLGVRWMSSGYLAITLILWIYFYRNFFNFKNKISFPKRIDFLSLSIITLGTILNLSAVWFIGVKQADGLFFCCRGVPDAIYHLSLTNQIVNTFPPTEPGMDGVLVKNYHFLSNLVVADISRVFKLDFIRVQFQFMSVLLALLLGSSAFVLSNILKLGKSFGHWLALFLYASGDILYLLPFLRGQGFNFGVTILDDATKLLAGPPRAFSIVILLGGIALFLIWIKKKDLYPGLIMAILMGTLIGFKVYTGLFALMGISAIGVYFVFKKNWKMILPLIIAILISLSYHFQINRDAGGIYFNGLWRFENFAQHKNLAISKLDYLRLSALDENKIYLVIALEVLFIIIYFTFLFGTTILGLFQNKKSLKIFPEELNIFLIPAIFGSLIIGSFFLQHTGGANTVQFVVTVFIVASIYASLSLYFWIKKLTKYLAIIASVAVLILTLPRAINETSQNLLNIYNGEGMKLSNAQLESIGFLRNNTSPNALFVVEPWMAENEEFLIVTFLSDRSVFLAGANILRDHGHDTKLREQIVKEIYNTKDPQRVKQLLSENKIKYIYVPPGIRVASADGADILERVFDNGEFKIYKVI